MLAYASDRRRLSERRASPQAMLAIAVLHVAAIAAVMSAKMELPDKIKPIGPIDLIDIPVPPPPKPQPQPTPPRTAPSTLETVPPVVPLPQPTEHPVDVTPIPLPPVGDIVGPRVDPIPRVDPLPPPREIVRTGPRFATPDYLLRPPYPVSKLDSGEEAVLKLRLGIDPRGRVVSVEPVGRADPAFLTAARRHLTARWRYNPATEDGRAVASSTVITLRFELEG